MAAVGGDPDHKGSKVPNYRVNRVSISGFVIMVLGMYLL